LVFDSFIHGHPVLEGESQSWVAVYLETTIRNLRGF
jgi:hypothetical protein